MKISKIVDLSIPITAATPVYPGDPKPAVKQAAAIDQDGYNVSQLIVGSHTGTHVDAPFHFKSDGLKMDELPLTQFMGRGQVFDVRGKQKGSAVTLEDVRPGIEKCRTGDIALFLTGWSRYAGTDLYFEHPYLDLSVIQKLLEQGISTIFIDALNIDPPDGSSFLGHEAILGANGVIGENFTNFELIDFPDPLIVALPLKLEGLDGSPVRAAAIQVK
ncbi:cyclase family protein [Bacillus massiliglaciei]|uniref:cyclase family protein n=1 Tax=Bacillus massiliglaciei TaxID=1816693 RepID=UPI000A9A27E3|nr:cyclase family protein [Bacillus massiliglaciei]